MCILQNLCIIYIESANSARIYATLFILNSAKFGTFHKIKCNQNVTLHCAICRIVTVWLHIQIVYDYRLHY